MIKTFLSSLLFLVLFLIASITDILAIIAHKVTFYVALGLLVVVLITTIIVIKTHNNKGLKNEEDDK